MFKSGRTALVTGVTGFVGGAIAIELLENTDANVVCLVRASDAAAAAVRLRESLDASADMYGVTLTVEQLARCRAVQGDITMSSCGVEQGELSGITECWHSAASLAFEDDRAEEISAQNEGGTRNVVQLARKSGCTTFNYISTAYVAGSRRGVIAEGEVPESTVPNNHYERTKIAAECIVREAGFATTRIFRPSIVIGHSKTRQATTFSGLYGFIRGLQRARAAVQAAKGDLLKNTALRLRAEASTPLNLIPIDYVARTAVKISTETDASGTYHLANSTPPIFAKVIGTIADVLDMVHPRFVENTAEFSLIDQAVDDRMTFYRSYISDEKYFSVANVEAILGSGALACSLDSDEMIKYIDWYVEHQQGVSQLAASAV